MLECELATGPIIVTQRGRQQCVPVMSEGEKRAVQSRKKSCRLNLRVWCNLWSYSTSNILKLELLSII